MINLNIKVFEASFEYIDLKRDFRSPWTGAYLKWSQLCVRQCVRRCVRLWVLVWAKREGDCSSAVTFLLLVVLPSWGGDRQMERKEGGRQRAQRRSILTRNSFTVTWVEVLFLICGDVAHWDSDRGKRGRVKKWSRDEWRTEVTNQLKVWLDPILNIQTRVLFNFTYN